jgi:hypothetical protein
MDDRFNDSTDGRIESAKDAALGSHDSHPSHADEAGEAAGGIGGVLAGAAIGSVAGPVGTLIGGIAGAMGGWWTGRAVTEAASKLTKDDDAYYQQNYENSPNRLADRAFEDVRPAYHLGQIAAQNPDYAHQSWDEVSSELQRGWTPENNRKYGEWSTVSRYAGEGFARGRAAYGHGASVAERAFDRATSGAPRAADSQR